MSELQKAMHIAASGMLAQNVRVRVISFVSKLSRAVSSLEDTRCYTNSC